MKHQDLTDIVEKTGAKKLQWTEEEKNAVWIHTTYLFPGDDYPSQVTLEKFSDSSFFVNPQQGGPGQPQDSFLRINMERQADLQVLWDLAQENLERFD